MSRLKFWMQHGLLPALLLLPLLLALEHGSLDFSVADHFYDPDRGIWIGGGTWWAKSLIHEGGRRLILLVGLSSFALWAGSMGFDRLQSWGRPALFVGLSVLACTSLVALLKHYSNVDCPEDLVRYGGDRLYVHVFADKPDAVARGACFPGGHSSGAFSLVAFYFLLRERHPRRALLSLAAALLLGGIYAVAQWTRGKHFPSHDLWSAAICWYVTLLVHATVFAGSAWKVMPVERPGSQ